MASSTSKLLSLSPDDPSDSVPGKDANAPDDFPIRRLLFLLLVFALQFFFFGYVAFHRLIDSDEGFYLLASRLVLAHKKPYIDFLFGQGPLFPYVYALWMKLFGSTWTSSRMFAALLTASTGTLLCDEVWYQTRQWIAAGCAALMFAGTMLIFGFFPIAKTFSLAGLFVFAAYVVVNRLSSSHPWQAGLGGLLLGLSMDTRSYLLVVVPFFLWWIIRNTDGHKRSSILLWFIGGTMLGLLPALYFFLTSPELFLFNNLGYHALRSDGGLIGNWEQKLVAAFQLFLMGPESNGAQTAILLLVSGGLLTLMPKRRYPPRFAFNVALAVVLVSLLPTPAWPQYFCLCIPFLLVSAICVVHDLVVGIESRRAKALWGAACALLMVGYIAAAIPDFRRYLVTGQDIPGVRSVPQPEDLRLERVRRVSQAIDEIAAPGETVASLWSGYIVETKTNPLQGLEGDYALTMSEKLNPERRHKYHLVSPVEIEASLATHFPRVFVLRDTVSLQGGAEWQRLRGIDQSLRDSLRQNGYTVVRSIGGTSIYVCEQR